MKLLKNTFIALLILTSTNSGVFGQANLSELTKTILHQDSLFWTAYNACDVDKMGPFLSEDLEFYHDKGGLTLGLDLFTKQLKTGLCSPERQRLTRKAIEETVKVFPLDNYGAIISGDHLFYLGGNKDSSAKFTHVWKYENDIWKMSRVLSYDHQTFQYENDKVAVVLSNELLTSYVGKYNAPQTGAVTITKKGAGLELQAGKMQMILHAQSDVLFFHKESSLTFEFAKDSKGAVLKMIVRENGQIAEEARRIK